eukprot:scaffold3178_cov127-Cylindrotheca_fusiformis.AAC.1
MMRPDSFEPFLSMKVGSHSFNRALRAIATLLARQFSPKFSHQAKASDPNIFVFLHNLDVPVLAVESSSTTLPHGRGPHYTTAI